MTINTDHTTDTLTPSTGSLTVTGGVTGNASTATNLSTSRNFDLTGDVTGSTSSNLTSGVSIAATLANTAVTPASYTFSNLTIDSKGRVTSASSGTPVTTFSGGTTGLTPATATTGAVTLAGTLAVANGGTGTTTSTGSGSTVLSTSPTFTGTPAAPTATAGTNTTQLATTAFVQAATDAARQGLSVKPACRVTTTVNITLSTTQTIDGVLVAVDDRVLVKDQSVGSQNGIYVVALGPWTRATDFDANSDIIDSAFTFIEEGTVNADSGWVLTTNGSITIGTTTLAFAQFTGAGQIVAGAGLTKTGTTIDVVGTAGRIVANADTIDLASGIATAGTYKSITVDTYGRVTAGTNPTTLAGYGITDAQALDADLASIAGLAGTSGFLTKTAANTWSLDTNTYATSAHTHGNITNGGAIGTTASLPIITTTSGLLTTGSFGTTAGSFCQGDDGRLSDTRNTTNLLTFNNGGAGTASGGTFNGSAAVTISYNSLGAAPLASPTFTGIPAGPTAVAGTSTSQLATTAFVNSEIANDALLLTGGTLSGALIGAAGTNAAPGVAVGEAGTGLFRPATGVLGITTAGTEDMRFDAGSGLMGTTSSLYLGGSNNARFQIETNQNAAFSCIQNSNDANGVVVALGKSRGVVPGSSAIVSTGDQIAEIRFAGTNGLNRASYATSIMGYVDGSVAGTNVPGRLSFHTALSGTLTEVMRLTSDNVIVYNQAAPISKTAAATLTIAELKTGIIQYNGAVATLTLPTGPLMESAFNTPYTNMTFQFSVINTGGVTVTIGPGASHTIVGNGAVATVTSGRFATRRTAPNIFVTYRI